MEYKISYITEMFKKYSHIKKSKNKVENMFGVKVLSSRFEYKLGIASYYLTFYMFRENNKFKIIILYPRTINVGKCISDKIDIQYDIDSITDIDNIAKCFNDCLDDMKLLNKIIKDDFPEFKEVEEANIGVLEFLSKSNENGFGKILLYEKEML